MSIDNPSQSGTPNHQTTQGTPNDNEPLKVERNSPLPALIGLLVLVGGIAFALIMTLKDSTQSATSAIAVEDAARQPIAGPVSKITVTAETPVKQGQKFHVNWNDNWYQGTALNVDSNGEITIRYDGWGEQFDEVVHRDRLRLIE